MDKSTGSHPVLGSWPDKVAPTGSTVVVPATTGTIGQDQSAWPKAFVNQQKESYLTVKFEDFDEAGLARVRMGGGPVMTVDIGGKNLSVQERKSYAAEMTEANRKAPILLKNCGGTQFSACAVDGGNSQGLKVYEIRPGLAAQGEKKFFMDKSLFDKTINDLKNITAQIDQMKIERVAPPRPGQPAGDWLNSSMNSSINQTIETLKAKGLPYKFGAGHQGGDLENASALDCSAFCASVMRRCGKNLEPVMDRVPTGTAATMISQCKVHLSAQELLAHPRPGVLVGLSTGAHGPGVDHVAITCQREGKMCVAEFCPGAGGGGYLIRWGENGEEGRSTSSTFEDPPPSS